MMDGKFVPTLTYVLELENNKWYVGKSMMLNIRIGYHTDNDGSVWTKKYKFKRIEKVVVGDREKELTLQYMIIKGWQNVRGYSWCKVDLDKPPKVLHQFFDGD